jgi:spore coat protein A
MDGQTQLMTPLFGYGSPGSFTWPGRTFEVQSGVPTTVNWHNNLGNAHLLPVDTSLHWAYSLPGYTDKTIANDGVPIITHVHGSHVNSKFDGNPEFFFNPGASVVGPQWANVGGFTNKFVYDNSQPAGTVWYHDHALGITRLNVYAGMAGFYIIRDGLDTGQADNPLGLPAWPYEKAYAIQDRMFKANGELFYPAFPGDPFYADFITGEGAILPPDIFPDGGPTALAEFFGDHMLVNGMIWPYEPVRPRNYRLRLLNGCDSRFLAIRFRAVPAGAIDLANAGAPIPFWVIGSDQGLGFKATDVDTLLIGPGERYDVVFDFKNLQGMRIIMENIGGDAPFGGALVGPGFPAADLFPNRQTDRIMAFDVMDIPNEMDAFDPKAINVYQKNKDQPDRIRKVALFEGMDEFGRLQPLLGVAEPTVDAAGNTVNGALPWHAPTTENPALGATEIWEIYNATADAHPVHLHLVHFEVLDRQKFNAKLVPQPVVQHNGAVGQGFRLEKIKLAGKPVEADGVERAPKDMVTALPGQVTRIKAKFDKPGRYVWHCHILSHEDHEMMRVLYVGPGA